jgi:TIR domain-containing protein
MRQGDETSAYERYFRDPDVGDGVLKPPMSGPVCANLRTALRLLDYDIDWDDKYDESLARAILQFQVDNKHSNRDGFFGSGTRRLLTAKLFEAHGTSPFERMYDPDERHPPVVFLSYSWRDSEKVDKIDQWLRDHGVQVIRDNRNFTPGMQLPEMIRDAVQRCDKVVAVYSKNSKKRDWPSFERAIAEQKEQGGTVGFLIYLVLDNTSPPAHDPHRIYVTTANRALRDIGDDLVRGICGEATEARRIEYDENKLL